MFADKYSAKYDRAVACLTKDREALLAFFDFPTEHWERVDGRAFTTAARTRLE